MKLAPFFAISVALHAVAFFYPVPFVPYVNEELIPVTVLGTDQLAGESGAVGTAKATEISKPSVQGGSKKNAPANFFLRGITRVAKVEEHVASTSLRPAHEATQSVAVQISEPEQYLARPDNPSVSVEADPTGAKVAFASLAGTANAGLAGSGSGGGQGEGSSGAGQGSGAGSGGGFSHGDLRLTQARYKETPKPLYPERARKEGQQGRVLLRVLVDQEGKSKTVEISGSSGSETLDRAAVEAIRLWRFSPAHYGDKPVESWVRIPIDFRLTDKEN
ncbi:MAG TPA: energy transducer TonB [Candidatus Binatia bacterium]